MFKVQWKYWNCCDFPVPFRFNSVLTYWRIMFWLCRFLLSTGRNAHGSCNPFRQTVKNYGNYWEYEVETGKKERNKFLQKWQTTNVNIKRSFFIRLHLNSRLHIWKIWIVIFYVCNSHVNGKYKWQTSQLKAAAKSALLINWQLTIFFRMRICLITISFLCKRTKNHLFAIEQS